MSSASLQTFVSLLKHVEAFTCLDVDDAPESPGLYAWYGILKAGPQDWEMKLANGDDLGHILESFQRLLRKESLISGLHIDPKSFAMTLFGPSQAPLPPERLSAGERQLLAVSIIWALALASNRPLPVVIDTPLGRLDSVHREHLVERYIPYASHQVILLSTDKEIDEAHYAKLKPFIGRSYMLRHDDNKANATTIEPGYFF